MCMKTNSNDSNSNFRINISACFNNVKMTVDSYPSDCLILKLFVTKMFSWALTSYFVT